MCFLSKKLDKILELCLVLPGFIKYFDGKFLR